MAGTARYPIARFTIEKISWMKGEPAWMTELRMGAWQAYERSPLSKRSELEWGALEAFVDPPRASVPSHEWPAALQHTLNERGDEEGLIIQRDCTVLSRAITKEASRKGVIFTNLDTAVKSVPDLVRRYFAQQATLDSPHVALNTAFWNGGTFLYAPAHVEISLPFHTCYWMSSTNAALFPHTVVIAEAGSHISCVDEYISGPQPGFSMAVTEIVAREKARVDYFNLQNWGKRVHHVTRQASVVSVSGELHALWAELGAQAQQIGLRLETVRQGNQSSEEAIAGELDEKTIDALVAKGGDPREARYEMARRFFEPVLAQIANEAMREKIRHYVVGKVTGYRPEVTLERASQLHPEIRH